ncbi:MAG TPA: hypothetical protein VJN18_18690 [Polyangiaceae bacterium]|nr:hypothetical protein [Polyangiaceae bacterium]
MRLRVRPVLAAAVLLVACGGRYAGSEDSGTSGSSNGSGGSGQGGKKPAGGAGTAAAGGSVSVGGNVTGTAGTAVSTGGKAACGDCPDVDCGAGYVQKSDPNGCCSICVPLNCRMVACPGIACGSGSQLIYPPDQCCPICGPSNCEELRQGYFDFRSQIIERYNSFGCMQDSDCTLLTEGNACSSDCGTPIPRFYEKDAHINLYDYAAMACASCPPRPVPPCDPQLAPACVNGRCQRRPFR